MKLLSRLILLGGAVAFARSPQGKKAIGQARQQLDTPANRDKLKGAVGQVRGKVSRSSTVAPVSPAS